MDLKDGPSVTRVNVIDNDIDIGEAASIIDVEKTEGNVLVYVSTLNLLVVGAHLFPGRRASRGIRGASRGRHRNRELI